jgi:hypothetical protein
MSTTDPRFPASIQELWTTLRSEVVWLHGRWIIYRQLYGTSPERVDVLNRSASTFFKILQTTLLHDVQLSLSKLGDPAGSGAQKNLTLEALLKQLEAAGESTVAAEFKPLVASFGDACKKVRHRRNKWIAHFDLSTMLGSKVTPFEGPSRAELEAALEALRQAMNCVELHYTESQTMYEHLVMNQDGEHLIATLMQGLRYRELVRAKVIPPEDLRKHFKHGV